MAQHKRDVVLAYYLTCTAPLVKNKALQRKQCSLTSTFLLLISNILLWTVVGVELVRSLRRGDRLLKRYAVKMATRRQHKSDGCAVALAGESRQAPIVDKNNQGSTYDKGVREAWTERRCRLNTLHLLRGQRNV